MKQFLVLLIAVLAVTKIGDAAYCSGSPDEGERVNENPIIEGEMTFLRSTKNGMAFESGPENARFPVVHVWGTPYEMGYAQGELMKDYVREFVGQMWGFLISGMVDAFPGDTLSPAMKALIAEKGIDRALDWTVDVTAPYTPQAYYDEVRGIADATGLDYEQLYRINMLAELTKASCSFFGAWGTAVGKEGHSYQLRALDYETAPPFTDFPQVIIYHPSEGNAWAQVGWPGSIGILTGFSEKQLALSEIGVSFPDDSFGQGTDDTPPEIVRGEPWMFVVRDMMQFTDTLEEAEQHLTDANRTCNLVLGVGDGKENMVNGIEYSGRVLVPYDDETLLPVNDTWHNKIEDVVYNGMDWLCPAYNEKLYEQLDKYRGSITEEVTIRNILPSVQTGNLHVAVYDLTDSLMHVSFCRQSTADENEPHWAYERQFTRLHMKDLFAQAAPEV